MVFVGAAPDGYRGVDRSPFECGGLPGIVAGGPAAAGTPDEIEEEQKLCRAEEEGSPGDAAFHGEQRGERRGTAGDLGVVTRPAGQTLQVHGKESAIGGDE